MTSSVNLRRPPAYQAYPADMAAREEVKLMSLEELGLLIRMRWACWTNDTIPADPALLARVLGLAEADVSENLTPAVLGFFAPADAKGFGGRLECPELASQMARLLERREAQSGAAERTNAMRSANRDGKRGGKRHGLEKSRSEKNRTEKSAVIGRDELTPSHAQFVADVERAEGDAPA